MNRFKKILYPLPVELIDMIHNFYVTYISIHKYKKVVNEINSIDKKVKSKCFDDLTMLWLHKDKYRENLNYILYKEHFTHYFNSRLSKKKYDKFFSDWYFSTRGKSRKNSYRIYPNRKWIDS